jgi:hypothetical protein
VSVRPFDHLLLSADQVGGGHALRIPRKASHIVRAFEQHQPLHARMTQDVTVEARERAESRVCSIPKDSVTTDTHVDNRKVFRRRIGLESLGQS